MRYIVGVLLCILGFSSGFAAEPQTMQQAQLGGLHFRVPAQWQAESTISARSTVYRSPQLVSDPGPDTEAREREPFLEAQAQRGSVAVAWEMIDGSKTLQQWANEQREKFKDIGTELTVIRNQAQTIDGRSYWVLEMSYRLGTEMWQQRIYMTLGADDLGERRAWALVCSSAQSNWQQWEADFSATGKSLRVHSDP